MYISESGAHRSSRCIEPLEPLKCPFFYCFWRQFPFCLLFWAWICSLYTDFGFGFCIFTSLYIYFTVPFYTMPFPTLYPSYGPSLYSTLPRLLFSVFCWGRGYAFFRTSTSKTVILLKFPKAPEIYIYYKGIFVCARPPIFIYSLGSGGGGGVWGGQRHGCGYPPPRLRGNWNHFGVTKITFWTPFWTHFIARYAIFPNKKCPKMAFFYPICRFFGPPGP